MNSTPPEHHDTDRVPAPTVEQRLMALEERADRQDRELRDLKRALRFQGFDQDLLMNSLQYLIQQHPASSDEEFRAQILAGFAERGRQRALERDRELGEELDAVTLSGRGRLPT